MANRNTQGFGLVAAGTLGSTPSTAGQGKNKIDAGYACLLYTSPSPRVAHESRMPSSA